MKTEHSSRILLIDGTQSIHEELRTILGTDPARPHPGPAEKALAGAPPRPNWTFELESVCQGDVGLAHIVSSVKADRPFAMAFVDMHLPCGWDGLETVARLWEADPRLQVVVCTASSHHPWEEVLSRLDVQDRLLIVTKPFDALEVRQLARTLTAKWSLARRAGDQFKELEVTVRHLRVAQSELRHTSKELEAFVYSAGHFRLLADNVTDAFWIRSADMQEVHYVSPGFQRIWGRPTPTLYGSPGKWVDFIHPEDREHVVRAFSGLTGELRTLDIVYRITRPDGEIRWVRVRGFQVRDAADRLIRNTGIVTDVTEQKRAQAALDAAQAALLDASRRALSAYVDGIGHALLQEQSEMAAELTNLSRSIEHIQKVMTTQQSYAGGEGVKRD